MTSTSPAPREAPLSESQPGNTGRYEGGRAQAESGSRIIQNDFDTWSAASTQPDARLPAEHPRVRQLTAAWQAVTTHGLSDDPESAATRYRVLSHAAYALAACHENGIEEVIALEQLADHAGLHAARLWRTGEDLYLRSAKAVPYEGWRTQATLASLIVERNYRTWDASAAAAQAASHAVLWPHAVQLQHSWAEIRQHGLDDGPGPAAARYNKLVAACDTLAGEFTTDMPSAALSDLLQLYGNAHKHAIRLSRTAASLAASCSWPRGMRM